MSDAPEGAGETGSDQDPVPAADPFSPGAPTDGTDEAAAQVLDDLSTLEAEFAQSDDDIAVLVDLVQKAEAERDDMRDTVQRLQADFENYKRRVAAQQTEQRERAAEDLVRELLPVLDTCDAAVGQGHEQVVPVRDQLVATLQKLGLTEVAQAEVPFDPNVHEAVLHDEGEADEGPVVAEVLRTGYLWHQRTLRAAMVRVRG
ncbi:MAG: nucleotide exchange factor GrpE [Actinomycetes bacterium]